MRHACAAGLRVRAGQTNGDERVAWAWLVAHPVTEQASGRAIEAAYKTSRASRSTKLVREEQRKMLRVPRAGDSPRILTGSLRYQRLLSTEAVNVTYRLVLSLAALSGR
jgi:hypothetical protein